MQNQATARKPASQGKEVKWCKGSSFLVSLWSGDHRLIHTSQSGRPDDRQSQVLSVDSSLRQALGCEVLLLE